MNELTKFTEEGNVVETENEFLNNEDSSLVLNIPESNPNKIRLLDELDKLVIGQDEAKHALVDAVTNNLDSVRPKKGPLGVFFFVGKTGVGKTYTPEAFGEVLLGDSGGVVKINCEELQESHSSRTLFGAPPSYVGYGQPTILGSKNVFQGYNEAKESETLHPIIKRLNNFSIIILDEVEKAHLNIHQSLLSLMNEGKVIFPDGTSTDFSNTIIIMTSNLGADEVEKGNIGFSDSTEDNELSYISAYKELFSPEFRNRVDKEIVFEDLSEESSKEILKMKLNEYGELLKDYWSGNLSLKVSDDVVDYLLEKSFSNEGGGRSLMRVLKTEFEQVIEETLNDSSTMWDYGDEMRLVLDVSLKEDSSYCILLNRDSTPTESIKEEEKEVELVNEVVKGKITQTLSLPDKPNSMKEVVAECISLQSRYVKLYNLREDFHINFDTEMENILFELEEYGYSESDIEDFKNDELWKYFRDFNFITTYDGLVFPEDTFPVIRTKIVNKIVNKALDSYFTLKENKRVDFKNDTKVVAHIEGIIETVIEGKLNKDQLEVFFSMINKYYLDNKIQR